MFESLDYALSQRGVVLIEGTWRSGKSFSAQAWTLQHLGQARYVSLTSAPDDTSFYCELARSLGVACGHGYKTADLRERISDVLRQQALLLVIDEAGYLWSQTDRPKGPPEWINFLMTTATNFGVPVALIAGRNFSRAMRITERACQVWGSEQWHGRVRLRRELPDALGAEDLMAIARTLLPGADEASVMLLAGNAIRSRGYLGVVESAAARALFFASSDERVVRFEDVQRAIEEFYGSLGDLPVSKNLELKPFGDGLRDPVAGALRLRRANLAT